MKPVHTNAIEEMPEDLPMVDGVELRDLPQHALGRGPEAIAVEAIVMAYIAIRRLHYRQCCEDCLHAFDERTDAEPHESVETVRTLLKQIAVDRETFLCPF